MKGSETAPYGLRYRRDQTIRLETSPSVDQEVHPHQGMASRTKEPVSGADPFTQLKGLHLRIVHLARMGVHSFESIVAYTHLPVLPKLDFSGLSAPVMPDSYIANLRGLLSSIINTLCRELTAVHVVLWSVPRVAWVPILLIHCRIHLISKGWVVRIRVLVRTPGCHGIHV